MESCAICHKPILAGQESHEHHRGYCPRNEGGPCTCDLGLVHDACCPAAQVYHKLTKAIWN